MDGTQYAYESMPLVLQRQNLKRTIRLFLNSQLKNCVSLSASQHGFIKGRPCTCVAHLLTAFEFWTNWIDQEYGVDIVSSLDYRKAFDSVDHGKLIEKLLDIGVNCKLVKWIAAFLQDRKMKVKVKLDFSEWITVLSGVPQGLVLSSLSTYIHNRTYRYLPCTASSLRHTIRI